jgi:hypothetical protein
MPRPRIRGGVRRIARAASPAADNPSLLKDRFRCRDPGSPVERSVWTLLVEVADLDAEDVLEVTPPEDQHSVEALPSARG